MLCRIMYSCNIAAHLGEEGLLLLPGGRLVPPLSIADRRRLLLDSRSYLRGGGEAGGTEGEWLSVTTVAVPKSHRDLLP